MEFSNVRYSSVLINGMKIAFREAGERGRPKLLLLHGFPGSSHQYRDLLPGLSAFYHVLAPDYPGFGQSDVADPDEYAYTFEGISSIVGQLLVEKGFDHFGLFVQDYGGAVGFRIVSRQPEMLDWLIIQNTNAYEVGLTKPCGGIREAYWSERSAETERQVTDFLTRDAIKGIYLYGAKRPELVSPDSWEVDALYMKRKHAVRVNVDLFFDYRNNIALYPAWQDFFRFHQPKTLIFWGQSDVFFSAEGGEAYLNDLPDAELHRLEAGHFAIEDHAEYMLMKMREFWERRVG